MEHSLLIGLAVILVVAILFFVLRGRSPNVPTEEGHGLSDSAAHAVEDLAGPILGVDAHPGEFKPPLPGSGPADDLCQLKGLGPKAAAQLNSLGVTHFSQLAEMDTGGVTALDNLMGTFRGRIYRDQWIEQAKLLFEGNREEFEARYGKLSS